MQLGVTKIYTNDNNIIEFVFILILNVISVIIGIHIFPIGYSLFPIGYSLFPIPHRLDSIYALARLALTFAGQAAWSGRPEFADRDRLYMLCCRTC